MLSGRLQHKQFLQLSLKEHTQPTYLQFKKNKGEKNINCTKSNNQFSTNSKEHTNQITVSRLKTLINPTK